VDQEGSQRLAPMKNRVRAHGRGNRVRAELVSREEKKRSLSIATDTNDILNGY